MIGKLGGCYMEHGVTDVLHTHVLHLVLFALLPPLVLSSSFTVARYLFP